MNVEDHLGLVRLAAGRATRGGDDYEDAVQDGSIGLMVALERFDDSRETSFSSYAYPRIRGAILDGMRKRDKLPRSVRRKLSTLDDVRTSLRAKLFREPTSREVAAESGVSVEDFVHHGWTVALDEPALEDGHALQDLLAGDDARDQADTFERMLVVKARMRKLSSREIQVVSLIYFDGHNNRYIADLLGVTESRVSQVHSGALEKLRDGRGTPARKIVPSQTVSTSSDLDTLRYNFVGHLVGVGLIPNKATSSFVDRVVEYGFHHGHRVAGLAHDVGVDRRSLHRRLATYGLAGPNHWLMASKVLRSIWAFSRSPVSWNQCVRDLDYGVGSDLSTVCMNVTGLRPPAARSLICMNEGEFFNEFIPYLDDGAISYTGNRA